MRKEKSFVANNIRRLRLAKGLTAPQLAEKMQVQLNSIYRWEAGRHVPRSHLRLRLAEALAVNYHTIFSSEDDRNAAALDLSEAHRMNVLNDTRDEAGVRKDRVALRPVAAKASRAKSIEAVSNEQELSEKEADAALDRLIADIKSGAA